jgi:hypothetical protein
VNQAPENSQAKKPRRAKRALVISLLSFCIVFALALCVMAPTISNVSFWWAWLSPKITKVVGGSKLECGQVRWCGLLKICANYCENKEKSVIIEHFSISPISGEIRIQEWALANLPKEGKKKEFPRIPLPISVIILEKGDLSLVSEQFPPLDYIQLNRASLTGSHWFTKGHINGKNITWNGLIGDTSNIKAKINGLSFKYKQLKSLLNGEVQIVNAGYKSKPVEVNFKNLKVNKTSWFNHKLPDAQISGVFVLDELLEKLIAIKSLNLKSGQIYIHSEPLSGFAAIVKPVDTLNLFLDPFPASSLNPYLPYLNLPQNHSLQSLSGTLSGKSELVVKDFNKSKFDLKGKSLSVWVLCPAGNAVNVGPISAQLQTIGKVPLAGKLKTERMLDLKTLAPFLSRKDLQVQKGFASVDLSFERAKGGFKGGIQVENLAVKHTASDLGLAFGNGKFSLSGNNLKGILTAYAQNSADLIQTDLDLALLPNISGRIKVRAPKLTFSNLNFKKQGLELLGALNNFAATLKIVDAKPSSLETEMDVNNLKVKSSRLSERAFNLIAGKIKLNEAQELTLQDLIAELVDGDKAKINGIFKVNNLWLNPSVTTQDVSINMQSELKSFLELLLSLKTLNAPTWLAQISDPKGNLNADIRIKNTKISDFKVLLKSISANLQESKISEGNGLLLLNGNQLDLQKVNFRYGRSSNLKLDGHFTIPVEMPKLGSRHALVDIVSSFDGRLEGLFYPEDLLKRAQQKKYNVSFSQSTSFPVILKMKPLQGSLIGFDFESNFNSIGSINSEWFVTDSSDFPGYLIAQGDFNPENNYFNFNRLDCALNGLNLSAEAAGTLNNFTFKAFTDPLLDLGKFFKSVKGVSLKGSLNGWIEGRRVNFFDRKTFWNNLKLSLKTEDGQSVSFGPADFSDMEAYFESKAGKGFATLVVESGKVKDLPFENLNSSLNLQGNNLTITGLSLQTAGGEFGMHGNLNLLNMFGEFKGNAKKVNIGQIARGLYAQRGFSGNGDLTFDVNGYLASLIKGQKPVAAAGSFNLRNGNASQVLNLQKKLNLANVVFGGPLALNMNGLLEILAPTDNGYYKALYGNWKLDQNWIILPEVSYRGTNQLNLNMAGILDRSSNQLNINLIGSIPRIPVRVNSSGQASEVLNMFSQLSLNNVLGQLPLLNMIFDARPRVFKFTMKGNVNNQTELNNSATNSFIFLDSALYQNLPKPKLPERN